MKEYFRYVLNNFKQGNYTTGILVLITIMIYYILLGIGVRNNNLLIQVLSFVWVIIATGVCISWNDFWCNKKK